MIYIDLVNEVLVRLREDTIEVNLSNPTNFLSDPYYKSIGAHVNDAKDRVEDAWQWSALRNADVVPLDVQAPGTNLLNAYALPESADNHYIIKGMYAADGALPDSERSYYNVRQVPKEYMIQRYLGGASVVPFGDPQMYCVNRRDDDGNIVVSVYPQQDPATTMVLVVDRARHQDRLVNYDDRLLVPSLPVYSLATALASRERGEVGGTPTSELFAIADSHLSDAIAQDSALYPSEMDWYSAGALWHNTNVRTA